MIQYNTLILKLSNSQVSKLKSGIKNKIGLTLNLSSNLMGNSKVNFPRKTLLTDTHFSKYLKLLEMGHQLI